MPHSAFVVWSGEVDDLLTNFTPYGLSSLGRVSAAPMVMRIQRRSSVRVNLMALVMRFINTCNTRDGSSRVHCTSSSDRDGDSMTSRVVEARFSSASNIFRADRIRFMGWEGSGDTRRRLESRRERVRMSSIMRFWCMAQ